MPGSLEPPPILNFQEIVDEYYTPLFRFAYTLAKNEPDAGDLTQQAFAIYAEKGSTLKDPTKVKSWLFTTLYREFLRGRKRDRRLDFHEGDTLEGEAPQVKPDFIRSLDAKLAVTALQEVDEVYRAPLSLYYLQDHSYKEIAEILNIPIGTVMSRLSRGKSQLKSRFQEKEKEFGE